LATERIRLVPVPDRFETDNHHRWGEHHNQQALAEGDAACRKNNGGDEDGGASGHEPDVERVQLANQEGVQAEKTR
jgi:hypothetical protein